MSLISSKYKIILSTLFIAAFLFSCQKGGEPVPYGTKAKGDSESNPYSILRVDDGIDDDHGNVGNNDDQHGAASGGIVGGDNKDDDEDDDGINDHGLDNDDKVGSSSNSGLTGNIGGIGSGEAPLSGGGF